ncbi:hypothetical protein EV424DRAFT_1321115, partial [Suillus variegatus]
KSSHHAYILLAYLLTTCLQHIINKALRHHTIANLYHACMSCILALLKTAGIYGLEMSSGNDIQCHCHPLFACFANETAGSLISHEL